MSDDEKLAEHYKPIFILAKDEKYFPCSVNYIMNNSYLFYDEIWLQNIDNSHIISMGKLISNKGNRLILSRVGLNGDLTDPVLYYFTRYEINHVDIVYFMFFPYNEGFMKENSLKIERVVVRINYNGGIIASYIQNKWILRNELRTINDSVLVFISKGTHNLYNKEGGFFNKCSFGLTWNPKLSLVDDNTNWLQYKGSWSKEKEGCLGVNQLSWWKSQPIIPESPNLLCLISSCNEIEIKEHTKVNINVLYEEELKTPKAYIQKANIEEEIKNEELKEEIKNEELKEEVKNEEVEEVKEEISEVVKEKIRNEVKEEEVKEEEVKEEEVKEEEIRNKEVKEVKNEVNEGIKNEVRNEERKKELNIIIPEDNDVCSVTGIKSINTVYLIRTEPE